ncbi:hypothetical protein Drorol1_Dr00011668 [Drosera rotundifolia]
MTSQPSLNSTIHFINKFNISRELVYVLLQSFIFHFNSTELQNSFVTYRSHPISFRLFHCLCIAYDRYILQKKPDQGFTNHRLAFPTINNNLQKDSRTTLPHTRHSAHFSTEHKNHKCSNAFRGKLSDITRARARLNEVELSHRSTNQNSTISNTFNRLARSLKP